jgi:hypothetical protein
LSHTFLIQNDLKQGDAFQLSIRFIWLFNDLSTAEAIQHPTKWEDGYKWCEEYRRMLSWAI